MRAAVALAVALALASVLAWDARAARECDGLEVCIPVAGPWVAIPAPARGASASTVSYQLSCPRRSVVGGVDALVSERAIDVTFLGLLGSPVNPGITTSRSIVFVATYGGAQRRPTTFRPFVGCIPTSGGGRETTSLAAVRPGRPFVRRVRSFRVLAGTRSVAFGCARGERLVGSSHAVAFRRRAEPSESWLRSVRAFRGVRGGRVVVTARRGEVVPPGTRVEVQIHALCARRQP